MALDSLTASLEVKLGFNAKKNVTGSDYGTIGMNANLTQKETYSSATANAAAGGANELISFVQSISASSSATIDFTSLTNILAATGVSLARIKGVLIRLLSVAQDSVVGTTCTSVTVGNAASNTWTSQSGTSGPGTNTSVQVIKSGGWYGFGDESAGGTLVDASHKNLKITNDDGTNTAKVQISLVGGTT